MSEETTLTTTHKVPSTDTSPHAHEAPLSTDIRKLCALLAHIVMRGISKQKGTHNVSTD